MSASAEQLYAEALALPVETRAELTERLVLHLAQAIPPELERAQRAEVRRRLAEVEAGRVQLVPGEEALEQTRAELKLSAPR